MTCNLGSALTRPERLNGVCLGGPACGLKVETPNGGPDVILVTSETAEGEHVDAYAWHGSAEQTSGRWIWKHLHAVGKKGGLKS